MKKVVFLSAFIILSLFSCKVTNKEKALEKEIYFYPQKENFDRANLSEIYLDSLKDYSAMLNEIDRVACEDSVPVINYSNNTEKFRLLPWYECSESNTVSCPTLRSRIFIQNDSILTNNRIAHSIDSLDLILKKHLLNKGKDFNYSDSPNHAGIEIYFKENTASKEISDLLVDLSEKFNRLNRNKKDTLYLKIYFRDRPFSMLPPPPPPEQD